MVSPAGSVRLYDGLAELAGVSSRAIARKPVTEVAPAPALWQRDPDRVELSAAACNDGECDRQVAAKAQQVERQAQAGKQQEPGGQIDVYA